MVGQIEDEYPRHPRITPPDLLVTDGDLLALTSQAPEAAIQEMVARISAPLLTAGADVAGLAIAREREMPTDLGFGMAVPHARAAGLDRPLVVFGRSPGGVVFDPQSPERVRLIFLPVTPADQPNLQVLLLSQLVGLAGDPETRRRLLRATSAIEVGKILATRPAGPERPAGER